MSLGREIDHWGTNPGDLIDAALAAIEAALHDLLASDPAYWRAGQKKDVLERLEKLQAQQAALKLRVLAAAGDIAEETGAKDAAGWMRTELLVDKAVARAQIKLAAGVAKYDLVAAGLAAGVVSQDKARVITKALDAIEVDPAASSEDLVLAEKLLVDHASRLTANELRIVGKRILSEIDPERFEQAEATALHREEERAARRTFFTSRDNGDGTVDVQARVSRPTQCESGAKAHFERNSAYPSSIEYCHHIFKQFAILWVFELVVEWREIADHGTEQSYSSRLRCQIRVLAD